MAIPIIGQGERLPADQGTVTEIKDNGPKIRVLYCWNCRSIEEIPDYEGDPEYDDLLQILVERHETTGIPHNGTLFKVGVNTWSQEKYRNEIIDQIREKGGQGLANLDPDYYNTKATFYEDAMKCYSLHLRPVDHCYDWKNERKRLLPKTAELRKDAGLAAPSQSLSTKVYLCDFCPVKSMVMTKQRKAAGMYNE